MLLTGQDFTFNHTSIPCIVCETGNEGSSSKIFFLDILSQCFIPFFFSVFHSIPNFLLILKYIDCRCVVTLANSPKLGLDRRGRKWHIDGSQREQMDDITIYHMVEVPSDGRTGD